MGTESTQPRPSAPTTDTGPNQPRPEQNGPRRPSKHALTMFNPSTYKGECTDLGVILALQIEWSNKKVSLHHFIEKTYFHIVINFKDSGDLYPSFHSLNVEKTDSLVWGQFSTSLQSFVQGISGF